MDSIKLGARNEEAERQAIELGELVPMATAREELTDAFLLFAIESGLLKTWAGAFPAPRSKPEMGMEMIVPAHMAGRFAGLYSLRKTGYVLRSAQGWAPWSIVWKSAPRCRGCRCAAPRRTNSLAALRCARSWFRGSSRGT